MHTDEVSMQNSFREFLEKATHLWTKKEALLVGCSELDIRVNTIAETKEKTTVFIEVKAGDDDLEEILLRTAIYAYKRCAINKETSLDAVIAAVVFPNHDARIGALKLRLNETTFGIEHSSFEIVRFISWETEKEAQELVEYLLSHPQDTTGDARTVNITEPIDAEETRRQPAPSKRRRYFLRHR
ncbi:MAG: uncharacterized protein A8A55_1625 [Amphiamblys sp. WSBS2006]|nr:MAG: uncharacterized protein A8A55_1625 [Amphiamblys sp. WSBS2006]